MFSYFENLKTIKVYILCLNFSMKTKIKTLFLISHVTLSKQNGTLESINVEFFLFSIFIVRSKNEFQIPISIFNDNREMNFYSHF